RVTGDCLWAEVQFRIFGVAPDTFVVNVENIRDLIPYDGEQLKAMMELILTERQPQQTEFRVRRKSDGALRWCLGTAAPSMDAAGNIVRLSGVTVDITERKESEERQALLAREV